MSGWNARTRVALVALGVLCMAPTAGDVGGCGAEVTALDPIAFAQARKDRDCERCQSCSLRTPRCARACNKTAPPDTSLPSTCRPLEHDGEVCLRALAAASCETYTTYVGEIAPALPSECAFCLVAPASTTAPGFARDASVEGGP